VLGAVAGTVFDGFHTFGGRTEYAAPVFLRMAWWTPPLFAFAAVAVGGAALATDALRARPLPAPSRRAATLGFAAFGLAYLASGFLPASNVTVAVLLAATSGALWLGLDRTLAGAVAGVAVAAVGCTVEVVLTRAGLFRHTRPDVSGLPVWLPFLYVAASFSIGGLVRVWCAATSAARPEGR
jgi:hypothetical protein